MCKDQELKQSESKNQPPKPKWEITNITNSLNTKRTFGQPSEQLFPKRWPLSNRNRLKINNMNTHKVKRYRNSDIYLVRWQPKQIIYSWNFIFNFAYAMPPCAVNSKSDCKIRKRTFDLCCGPICLRYMYVNGYFYLFLIKGKNGHLVLVKRLWDLPGSDTVPLGHRIALDIR